MSNDSKGRENQRTLIEQQAREAVARYNAANAAARAGSPVESYDAPSDDTEEHRQMCIAAKAAVQKWLQSSGKLVRHDLQNTEEAGETKWQTSATSTATGFIAPVDEKPVVTPQTAVPKSVTSTAAQTTMTPQRETVSAGLPPAYLRGRTMLSTRPTTADIRALMMRMCSHGRALPPPSAHCRQRAIAACERTAANMPRQ